MWEPELCDDDTTIKMTMDIITTSLGHRKILLPKIKHLHNSTQSGKCSRKQRENAEFGKRLTSIKAELQDLLRTAMKSTRTWAQVASTPPTPQLKPIISPKQKQFVENTMKQRG
jgi:hypothetical protein